MSEELDVLESKENNQKSIQINSSNIPHINFVFQDEKRISIPLSFFENLPNSLLLLAYKSPANYLEDVEAYYIDSPSLFIDKVVEIFNNLVPLDSFSFRELIDVDKTIKYFLGDDFTEYHLKIDDFLVESLKTFIEENNCELDSKILHSEDNCFIMTIQEIFTEERNKLFLQYSCLFEYFNVYEVCLKYNFSSDIPYEYIYPSNLHELFPKIKNYIIQVTYYPEIKFLQVKSTDTHYITLYKEYKRQYYKEYYPYAYRVYSLKHPEIEQNILKYNSISVDPIINNKHNRTLNIKDIHEEFIDIDIDEEIKNEKEEKRPDLYIDPLCDYSRNYTEEMIGKNKHDFCINDQKAITEFNFSYIHDGTDKPQFMLQLEIPPLLLLLKDSLYASLKIFDFSQFIHQDMYPEYIQLFKHIITTHVFPNVTTLQINSFVMLNSNKDLIREILSLITRDRFPKLHIYNLLAFDEYSILNDSLLSDMDVLVPISLLQLIDIIQPGNNSYFTKFPKIKTILDNLIISKKQHNFTFKVDIKVHNFNKIWKQLYNNELLRIHNIDYIASAIYTHYDNSSLDLIDNNDNNDYGYNDEYNNDDNEYDNEYDDHEYDNEYDNDEYNNDDDNEEYDYDYIYNSLSFLCNGNYKTVTHLSICPCPEIERIFKKLKDSDRCKINQLLYKFFSLFSENITEFYLRNFFFTNYLFLTEQCFNLSLWSNIQQLSLSLGIYILL
ncbi:hypothetical protein WA158_001512 [Blastocystis sp. Blastoise]